MDAEIRDLQRHLETSYRFERELGRGGMGVVYLARDLMLDRPVAIKVLPHSLAERADLRERFLREARTAGQLSHPHIVPIFRADEVGGHAFFVMGFVDGESLAERLEGRGPLPLDETVRVLREVAWALAYAHARGVIHRDIKPENIMLERGSGRAIVTDFGIAHTEHFSRLTADGNVLGTVHYMSPEQVAGEALDGRSDLYALGVVGFRALSGRLPFDETVPSAILVAHVNRLPPRLREVAPFVPDGVATVIDRCLAKSRDDRFESGEALAEALEKALDAAHAAGQRAEGLVPAVFREDEAMAIWRRAAQLQAEAAQRLEQRARRGATLSPGATPADGFRLREVEAAAVEAGISQHFVAIAVAELPRRSGEQPEKQPKQELAPWQERAATRWFGSSDQSLSVSRVVRASPRRTLQAIGRALPQAPHSLRFQSQAGPHPLDGGVMVFEVPDMGTTSPYPWLYTRYGVFARTVRIALRPLAGDSQASEVVMYVDLRRGLKLNLYGSAAMMAAAGGGGAATAALVATKGFAIAGTALAFPVLGGLAITGVAASFGFGAAYRFTLRKVRDELERALQTVENDVQTEELFGVALTPWSPSPARGGPAVDPGVIAGVPWPGSGR